MKTNGLSYLYNPDFLLKIDSQRVVNHYVKITLLDWQENPIREIQGLVTGGTINLNGKSAIRRTCNLTVAIENAEVAGITNINNLFSINKKMFLEIGYSNNTNEYKEYPIIWFPQGLFIMNTCSISRNNSGISVSISAKDKMCLLDGSCGGMITSSTEFDKYETVDENGHIIISQPTIYKIIQELVNHIGGEQLGKIYISDVDNRIKTIMRWVGDSPVYLVNNGGSYSLTTKYTSGAKPFSYGDDIGYIYSDFVYTEDLIGDAGSSVCDILNKIVSYLGGNYEYYYDISGNFIFKEITNYLNTTQAKVELNALKNDNYMINRSKGKSLYDFKDSSLITSYSNTPQYANIKNDFVVWGLRKTDSGNSVPIRYHLAIDKKPIIPDNPVTEVIFYTDEEDGLDKLAYPLTYTRKSAFPEIGTEGFFYWDTQASKLYKWSLNEKQYIEETNYEKANILISDWRSYLYVTGLMSETQGLDTNYYYPELKAEWPKLYNFRDSFNSQKNYYEGDFYEDVKNHPENIDYFLDFIDSRAAIGEFSIDNIGRRSIAENSESYNCVFAPEIPDFVLIEKGKEDTETRRQECEARGQNYIQIDSNIYSLIATGGIANGCFDEIKALLYQHTKYNNSIQIQGLPIYHIEPNTRISVLDPESDIYGDYIIDTISLPLAVGGTMSISATKAIEKL